MSASRFRSPTRLHLEPLEDRATPAVLARFDYSVPDRFGLDANGDGRIDLPNSFSYARPASLAVTLDGRLTTGASSAAQFSWTVSGGGLSQPIQRTGPVPLVNLPQGTYTVSLTVADPSAGTSIVTGPITVKDILIVSLGDSYASGEGNPEVRRAILSEQWAVGGDAAATEAHRLAHRSSRAAPAQVALDIERANPRTSVTFIHLADSGATMLDLLGPTGPIQQAKNLVGTRTIDSLLLSIGGNDIGFAKIAKRLFFRDPPLVFIPPLFLANIEAFADEGLAQLPGRYQAVDAAIRSNLNVSQVYLTEYADMSSGHDGVCDQLLGDAIPGDRLEFLEDLPDLAETLLQFVTFELRIDQGEAQFARDEITEPLRQRMQAAAFAHGWNFIGGLSAAFSGHGYCVGTALNLDVDLDFDGRFVRTITESRLFQGNKDGALHPNEAGHRVMANVMTPRVLQGLGPIAQLGGPPAVTAGGSVTLSSAGSTGRLAAIDRVEWDFDFRPEQGFTVDRVGTTAVFTPPPANVVGTRTVAVRVTDVLGFSNVATKVVTIFPTPGAVLQGNLLRVNGSNSAADVITLSVSGTSVVVQQQGLANRSFPLAGVAQVVVDGFAGQDTLQAAATFPRQVLLFGGVGNDTLRGGAAGDVLDGGDGDDFLDGRGGADLNDGGAGNDTIVVDPLDVPDDVIDGGDGIDGILVRGTARADVIHVGRRTAGGDIFAVVTINGRRSENRYAHGETVTVFAGAGNDVVVMGEDAGSAWSAEFHGGAGNDVLIGGALADRLFGDEGNDWLLGMAGDDELVGGTGWDTAIGSLGADWFRRVERRIHW